MRCPVNEPLRVLFAAGQTAGHVNPALAIAAELKRRQASTQVFFASTRHGFERELILRAGYTPEIVRAAALRGGSPITAARGLTVFPAALADALTLVRRLSPDLTIGVGGYLSGAIVLAAALQRRPTLIVEPNVCPGLANRCLAPLVDAVAVASAATIPRIGRKATLTGNPVRARLFEVGPRHADGTLNLLVVGGTQGAHALNRALGEALPALGSSAALTIAHQTGRADLEVVREVYRRVPVAARVEAFFDDIAGEYEQADLVVAAAGATTCAELAAVGRASILIPLAAAGHHQRENARAMERAGAAIVIDERQLSAAGLVEQIVGLLRDGDRRRAMAAAAARVAHPEAARSVVDLGYELAGRDRPRSRRSRVHQRRHGRTGPVAVEERDAP